MATNAKMRRVVPLQPIPPNQQLRSGDVPGLASAAVTFRLGHEHPFLHKNIRRLRITRILGRHGVENPVRLVNGGNLVLPASTASGELDKLPAADATQILRKRLIALDSGEMNRRGAFVAFIAEHGLK